jgi:creatinine amidohydrolase
LHLQFRFCPFEILLINYSDYLCEKAWTGDQLNSTGKLWGQMERLRPRQFDAILRESPVAYLPWGALEYHSYHNPIGLDGLKSHGLLCALARECGGVVFPPVFAGHATIKTILPFNHSIEISAATLKTLAMEYLRQIAQLHFQIIVLMTGHYSEAHVDILTEASRLIAADLPGLKIWTFSDKDPLEGQFPPNHAARGETSFQMHFDPDLVDLSELPKDRVTTLERDGVWGEDPRLASAEEGERMVIVFLEKTVPQLSGLLRELNLKS